MDSGIVMFNKDAAEALCLSENYYCVLKKRYSIMSDIAFVFIDDKISFKNKRKYLYSSNIPDEIKDTIFERFVSNEISKRRI